MPIIPNQLLDFECMGENGGVMKYYLKESYNPIQIAKTALYSKKRIALASALRH